jgi:hypothetical protein
MDVPTGSARFQLATSIGRLRVRDATLRQARADELHVVGEVELPQSSSEATVVHPGARFLSGDVQLGRVRSQDGKPPVLRLVRGGNFHMTGVPDGTIVELGENAQADFADSLSEATGVVIRGFGRIYIRGTLTSPRFEPGEALVADVTGSVLDASGELTSLRAHARSAVSGDPHDPLKLKSVSDAASALLEQVDIYSLSIGDLSALEQAERLSPWIPPARKARKLEDGMALGGGSQKVIQVKRAHFWARVSIMVRDKHAPGAVQSEVRYAAQRARRKSLPIGRERLVLTLYQLVGFGERILRPMLWYAALSAAVALMFNADPGHGGLAHASFLSIWVSVLASPLAFLRLPSVGTALHPHGPAQQAALFFMRLIGLLLLVFALIAARRLAKAE